MWAKAGRLVAAVLLGTVVARGSARRRPIRRSPRLALRLRMPSVRSLRGDTTKRSDLYRDLARQIARCRRDSREARCHLLPGGQVRGGDSRVATCARAQARPSQSRRAARDVTVGGGAARRSTSGSQAGLCAWGGSAAGAAVGLHLQRAYMGLGRDADAVGVALELSRRYPDDPEVLYHTGRIVLELRLPANDEAAACRAGVGMDASGRGRSQRESGTLGCRHPRIRAGPRRRSEPPGSPLPHRSCASGAGRSAGKRRVVADGTSARSNSSWSCSATRRTRTPRTSSASCSVAAGELEKAVASFGAAVHSDPGFPDALVGLGRTLTTLNRASEAVPLLERATTLDPGSDVAFYLLSQAYGATGNAVGQQRRARDLPRLRAQKRGDGPSMGEGRPDVTKQDLPAGPGGG